MSKGMKILLLGLAAAAFLLLTVMSYTENRRFRELGKVAVVDPPAGYVEQTKTRNKNLVETKTTTHWAEMTYTNADGRKTAFKREITGEILEKFKNGEPVRVEYLPGEYNTERFVRAPNVLFGGGLTFLLFLITTAWVVVVIRKKEPSGDNQPRTHP